MRYFNLIYLSLLFGLMLTCAGFTNSAVAQSENDKGLYVIQHFIDQLKGDLDKSLAEYNANKCPDGNEDVSAQADDDVPQDLKLWREANKKALSNAKVYGAPCATRSDDVRRKKHIAHLQSEIEKWEREKREHIEFVDKAPKNTCEDMRLYNPRSNDPKEVKKHDEAAYGCHLYLKYFDRDPVGMDEYGDEEEEDLTYVPRKTCEEAARLKSKSGDSLQRWRILEAERKCRERR